MVELPQPRGSYRIIRVNGSEEAYDEKPRFSTIRRVINAEGIDTVVLTCKNGRPETVMMCDDTGMIDGKPVNPKATELYHSVCLPETIWQIHGDVALVNDSDFGIT